MNKYVVRLCCCFILKKKNRKHFREKYFGKSLQEFQILNESISVIGRNVELSNNSIINNLSVKLSSIMIKQDIFHIIKKTKNFKNTVVNNQNNYLLFYYSYLKYIYDVDNINFGDYVQTIAVKNALENISPLNNYKWFDRDNLSNYCGENIIAIMQGWFSHSNCFIPNDSILPVFVGTHFNMRTQDFLEQLFIYNKEYFDDKEIGCRDLFTLDFLKKQNINCYFSRCLTLTLPKRTNKGDKVFIVDLPNQFLEFIPQNIKETAVYKGQGIKKYDNYLSDWESINNYTEKMLNTYKNEASLVITSRLHCAAPCIAMGIPVVLAIHRDEQWNRFTALDGIIPLYTIEDFKNNRVVYPKQPPFIEDLKYAMLENLELSIKKTLKINVDENRIKKVREYIANFRITGERAR